MNKRNGAPGNLMPCVSKICNLPFIGCDLVTR